MPSSSWDRRWLILVSCCRLFHHHVVWTSSCLLSSQSSAEWWWRDRTRRGRVERAREQSRTCQSVLSTESFRPRDSWRRGREERERNRVSQSPTDVEWRSARCSARVVLGWVAFTFRYWQDSTTFVKKTRSTERGGEEGNSFMEKSALPVCIIFTVPTRIMFYF